MYVGGYGRFGKNKKIQRKIKVKREIKVEFRVVVFNWGVILQLGDIL